MGHPAKQLRGTKVQISWKDLAKHCPKWLWGVVVAVLVYAFYASSRLPFHSIAGEQIVNPSPLELRLSSTILMALHAVSVGLLASTVGARNKRDSLLQ